MKRFIIRPSVGIVTKVADKDIVISFYYCSGERRLIIKIPLRLKAEFDQLVYDGIVLTDTKYGYDESQIEMRELVEYLLQKEILINAEREDWLGLQTYNQFDRQLRLISEKLPLTNKPSDIQNKIFNSRIVIVGLGGVGSNVLQQLTAMGFQHFCLIDRDKIETSNLNRQPIYTLKDIGYRKADVAADWVRNRNSSAEINTHHLTLSQAIQSDVINNYYPEIVVNCADIPSVLDTTNEIISSLKESVPVLVGGGYYMFKAFSGPFILPGMTACLACGLEDVSPHVFQNISAAGGNIMPVAAMVASIASASIMSYMINPSDVVLLNSRVELDLEKLVFKKKVFLRNRNCVLCGDLKVKYLLDKRV